MGEGVVLSGIAMSILRNDGKYVIWGSIVIMLIVLKEKRKLLLYWGTAIAIMLGLFFNALMPTLHITPASRREALSVPFQQTARYFRDYESEVTEEEYSTVAVVLKQELLKEKYNPQASETECIILLHQRRNFKNIYRSIRSMDKIAVLIPCYNEEKTIKKVIEDFNLQIPEATIYVYDNNSIDATAELAQKAGAVIRHEFQQGKGNVIRRMFREIDAEVYIMVDGDDTYPAKAAPEMVRLVLENNSDMVVGDRLSSTYFTENKRPFHNFGNSIVRSSINKLFHTSIKDIMTGYRAFSYQFVKSFPVLSKGFEIETEMSIHAVDYNMQVDNVVIEYRDRPEGSESKLNTFTDGLKVIKTIIRLFKDYKPFEFFTAISGVLAAVSIIFLVPVLFEYFETGFVMRFPTLIVCCFVMLMAILLFVAGIILSTLRMKDKRDFEYKLQEIHCWMRKEGEIL